MSCTARSGRKVTGNRRTKKGKERKGKRGKKPPLSFVESPCDGEFTLQDHVLGALHPVTASAKPVDFQAEGKWVSPQFNKHLEIEVRTRKKGQSCCRMARKKRDSLPVPYSLRSQRLSGVASNMHQQTKTQSVENTHLSKSNNCNRLSTHSISSCSGDGGNSPQNKSMDFENGQMFTFRTPDFTKNSGPALRKRLHHLFSARTPTLNSSVTVLVEDTP